MPPVILDLVFASALPVESISPTSLGILFPSAKEAQSHALSFSDHLPVVFLPHLDKGELQRCASAKVPALIEVHSMQGAFDALKLSGVKFVLVNPLRNKATIDVAWMSVAKQRGLQVVFALHDVQESLRLQKSRALEEFQKLARLLVHYEIPYFIASFARSSSESIGEEASAALRAYLEQEKLLHRIQLDFESQENAEFLDENETGTDAEEGVF
ncbi:MAG: hypothetical protein IPJ89_05300 [Candidatus Iainarchaeum archaeon]|uniref:Uncharacterized protein n=1 Tax=Candidatus Iainarchaeum sp. TaxID=3101447 RepID=A0A7T9DJL0_9ARCH|nr:MAG: hypothetical protein IPJ89_05300 [Candidatus Diapherotrites archaeon]